MKQFILSILIITFSISSYSQTGIDSITYQNRVDSTSFLTMFRKVLASHPYYNFLKTADVRPEIKRIPYSADTLFYVILGLFFYFAIVKTLFERYVNNLVALFLRLTLRQQQLREQLLQAPFPSLLLNILFLL